MNLEHTLARLAVKSLAVNAKATLTCPRCGIVHTIKLTAYQKRMQRNEQPKLCIDCRPIRGQVNGQDFWLYVKTTLRLTAN